MLKNQSKKIERVKLVANHENYMSAFRDNIGILRTYHGYSVRVLAEKADINYDTLSGFLKGNAKTCNLSTAVKLAKVFDISIDELIGAETIDEKSRESLDMARKLPDYVMYLIRSFIRHQYNIHTKFDKDSINVPVLLPECKNGYLITTNVTTTICVDNLTPNVKSKACIGLQIPCEHYEPFYMPNDILLLATDRSGLNNERCVVVRNGNYFICIKKIYIENGEKKVKYFSIIDDKKEVFSDEIEDRIGYIIGFLNPDGSWGIR